jgi:hypothetical protein
MAAVAGDVETVEGSALGKLVSEAEGRGVNNLLSPNEELRAP